MGDLAHLLEAKKGDLTAAGIILPSDAAAKKAITKEELLRHCRRRTRGVDETIKAIEQLLLSLSLFGNRYTRSMTFQRGDLHHLE